MADDRGLERLVFFGDAVVAIALTLLVLPLVDLANDASGRSTGTVLRDHTSQVGAFALSFVVIASLWRVHHRLFQGVGRSDERLVTLDFVWLFTVVLLPFPTELLAVGKTTRLTTALYVGTLLASSVALWLLADRVQRRPGLRSAQYEPADHRDPWVMSALLAVALAVALAVPVIGLWALLVLLLRRTVERILARRRRASRRS